MILQSLIGTVASTEQHPGETRGSGLARHWTFVWGRKADQMTHHSVRCLLICPWSLQKHHRRWSWHLGAHGLARAPCISWHNWTRSPYCLSHQCTPHFYCHTATSSKECSQSELVPWWPLSSHLYYTDSAFMCIYRRSNENWPKSRFYYIHN